MPFKKLVSGYRSFYKTYFTHEKNIYDGLVKNGQTPETLVIGCSDSRSDPAHVMNAQPGEMFVVRNVAAIVPPYKSDSLHHGTSAAIEFAVKGLKVRHIVVMGHSLCGGIHALANKTAAETSYEFLTPWMDIGNSALEAVERELADASPELKQRALEQAVILVSMNNLMTFPWIKSAVEEGSLHIHGWYFDLKTGELLNYDKTTATFAQLEQKNALGQN